MTETRRLARDRALPARFAVVGGATHACVVGAFALLAAGHGISSWALMLAGSVAMLAVRLHWRGRVDGSPVGTSLGAAGVMATVLGLLLAGGLLARAVAVDVPWLAALVALVVGVTSGALMRWWQLRPVLSPV